VEALETQEAAQAALMQQLSLQTSGVLAHQLDRALERFLLADAAALLEPLCGLLPDHAGYRALLTAVSSLRTAVGDRFPASPRRIDALADAWAQATQAVASAGLSWSIDPLDRLARAFHRRFGELLDRIEPGQVHRDVPAGWYHLEAGRADVAVRSLEATVQAYPAGPWFWQLLGDARFARERGAARGEAAGSAGTGDGTAAGGGASAGGAAGGATGGASAGGAGGASAGGAGGASAGGGPAGSSRAAYLTALLAGALRLEPASFRDPEVAALAGAAAALELPGDPRAWMAAVGLCEGVFTWEMVPGPPVWGETGTPSGIAGQAAAFLTFLRMLERYRTGGGANWQVAEARRQLRQLAPGLFARYLERRGT
jgi:hypothetical protein